MKERAYYHRIGAAERGLGIIFINLMLARRCSWSVDTPDDVVQMMR